MLVYQWIEWDLNHENLGILVNINDKSWLMITVDDAIQYIGDYNPIEGSQQKPTRIQWNERGILNTAHLMIVGDPAFKYSKCGFKKYVLNRPC